MDDNEKKYLLELHKENSIFFNKLLQAIPFAFIGILLCSYGDEDNKIDAFFIKGSLIFFVSSVVMLSLSFIVSDKAIDCIASSEEQVQAKGWFHNDLSKWLNNIVLILNILGLLFLTISFVKGSPIMEKTYAVPTMAQDGLTVSSMIKQETSTQTVNPKSVNSTTQGNKNGN